MDVWMKSAGSCGRYQVIHVTLTQLPRFMHIWPQFLMILAGYDPGWRCAGNSTQTPILTNATNETVQAFYSLTDVSMTPYGQDKSRNGSIPTYHLNVTETGGYDGTCDQMNDCKSIQFNPDSITLVTEFQLVCDQSWAVKLILVLCGAGGLPGSLMAGYIGERYGRRLGLYSFTVLMSFCTGLAIFSPHWSMYAVCSFFINSGVHGTITQANVYSMEFLNSKWRGYFGAIPIGPLSFFLLTFTIRYLRNWIYLHLVAFFLCLSTCVGFFVLPESPRWLMVQRKPEEAWDAIRKVARINRKPDPTFDCPDTEQLEQQDIKRKELSYRDLFKTKTLRVYIIKLFVAMTLFNVCFVGISFGLQALPGDFYTNIIVSGCCDIIILLLCSPLANKLGRRWAGMAVSVLGSVCCMCIILVLLLSGRTEYPILIKACAFVAKGISLAVYGICQLFVIELFPTEVRNLSLGVIKSGTCLGATLAPLVVPSPTDRSFIVSFSFSCFCFLFNLFVFVTLPETNKQNLPDTITPTEIHIQEEEGDNKTIFKRSTSNEGKP